MQRYLETSSPARSGAGVARHHPSEEVLLSAPALRARSRSAVPLPPSALHAAHQRSTAACNRGKQEPCEQAWGASAGRMRAGQDAFVVRARDVERGCVCGLVWGWVGLSPVRETVTGETGRKRPRLMRSVLQMRVRFDDSIQHHSESKKITAPQALFSPPPSRDRFTQSRVLSNRTFYRQLYARKVSPAGVSLSRLCHPPPPPDRRDPTRSSCSSALPSTRSQATTLSRSGQLTQHART